MPAEAIAVMSDTHGQLPEKLVKRLSQADEIWHLGDVTQPEVIEPLRSLPAPLSVVRGNCDPHRLWPTQLEMERHGFRFRLQHLPPSAGSEGLAAILYGHLHQPLQETRQGCRLLNPGAITQPRNGSASSFAWIRFPREGGWTWEPELL